MESMEGGPSPSPRSDGRPPPWKRSRQPASMSPEDGYSDGDDVDMLRSGSVTLMPSRSALNIAHSGGDFVECIPSKGGTDSCYVGGEPEEAVQSKSLGDTKLAREEPSTSEPVREEAFLLREGANHGDLLRHFASGDTFHSAYIVGEQIGEGGFGKVFLATHRYLGIARAVKWLAKTEARRESRSNELDALLSLNHPHIVGLVEYFDEDEFLYLVFELCQGPDLFDRIVAEPEGRMSEQEASIALRHMLKALQCCHAQYRGHYDIKPENFMYTGSDLSELMMIDLGLSSGFNSHRRYHIKGTEAYLAPECRRGIYGPEADIWSCGVVLFVMLTGQPFLPTLPADTIKDEIQARGLIRRRLAYGARVFKLSSEAQDLLALMLQHDRHERPTVKEALKHEFNERSYDLEQTDLARERLELMRSAMLVREHLLETFRIVAKEPLLKRVARLTMAHAGIASVQNRLAFRMLDQHGYGELSIGMIEKDLQNLDIPLPNDLGQLFRAIDLDRNGYISYTEFLAATLPASSLSDPSLCRVAFDMLDKGHDGIVDAADLSAVFGHGEGPRSPPCRKALWEVGAAEERLTWEGFAELMRSREVRVMQTSEGVKNPLV